MWTLEYLRGIAAPPDTKHRFPQIRYPFSTLGNLPGLATAGLRNVRASEASGKDRQPRAHFTLISSLRRENEGRRRARRVLIRQRTMSGELQPEVCQERT